MNKINVTVIVEKRDEYNITKEEVQEELERFGRQDVLDICCDEAMKELVDDIFERIVQYLKSCGNTLDDSECDWRRYGGGYLDDSELVRYLIKEVFDDINESILCSKCSENE